MVKIFITVDIYSIQKVGEMYTFFSRYILY